MTIAESARRFAVFAALAITAALFLTSAASAQGDCDIVGTEGDDVLVGTEADEKICGLGGADVLRGSGGHDVLIGGDGDDKLIGGPGNDLLVGGDGDDTLIGRTGRDRLVGQAGDDRLEGSNGRDRLVGGIGVDRCTDRRGVTNARGCEIGVGGVSKELHAARATWDRLAVDEFVYGISETPACATAEPACLVPQLAPVLVHVRDGIATAEADVVAARTAVELFDEAEAAETSGGTVDYHTEFGLPTAIRGSGNIVSVVEIEIRDGVRRRLGEARQAWADAELGEYAFSFRELCFCPGIVDVRVTVVDGFIVTTEPIDGEAEWMPEAHRIDWHLDRIEALLDGFNRSVTASFDRRLGYPNTYAVDHSALIADDELTVEIFDFDDPTALRIVDVQGIQVSAAIETQLSALLEAAGADGLNFGGGGYRDPARQIELREVNCGTSQYAIWDMPASECSPPTARPGQSMHEQGLAIDFTLDGQLVTSRASAGYVWLAANAQAHGFSNHPAEPWHWSVNGN